MALNVTAPYRMGLNGEKQLSIPSGLTNPVAIAAHGSHSMALIEEGVAELIPAAPALEIQSADTRVRVSWSASEAGFTLHQCARLDGSDWTQVTEVPTLVGSRYEVLLPLASQMFFQLKPTR